MDIMMPARNGHVMKPILTHVHLYYTEQWSCIKSLLTNIAPNPYALYVTMVVEDLELQAEILEFKPDAKIVVMENRGFDVWPFVSILNQVNLDDYSYIIKLHTKRFVKNSYLVNGFPMHGNRWRDCLYLFLKTETNFEKCLHAFDDDKKLGMIGNFRVILKDHKKDRITTTRTRKLLEKMGCAPVVTFVAGTMFMARAELFKLVQDMKLRAGDFPTVMQSATTTTFAHSMEQLLGSLIGAQGYEIKDVLTPDWKVRALKLLNALTNFDPQAPLRNNFLKPLQEKLFKLLVRMLCLFIPVRAWRKQIREVLLYRKSTVKKQAPVNRQNTNVKT